MPPGYTLEWGGDYEETADAIAGLLQMVPVFFLAMIFTVVLLFNAVRQTIIIFLCLPLLKDVFFVGMSITVIGGLTFGTILTLLVVPVMYSVFFRIRPAI